MLTKLNDEAVYMKTKKEIKELKQFNEDKRNKKNIEILGGFIYNNGEKLELFVYDKKKKKVFAGVLSPSSYSKKEILEREYCK